MRSVSQLKDFVYDESDEYPSFELDDVREVGDGDDGVTIRVIAEDGEKEADQVGFQVVRPNIDQGREMFNRSVLSGLRELRDRYRDDRSTDRDTNPDTESEQPDETTETPDSTTTRSDGTAENAVARSSAQNSPLGPLSVSLSIDDDDREQLLEEIDSIIDEIEDEVASESDIDRIEARLDEVDQRLTNLEDALSMIGK